MLAASRLQLLSIGLLAAINIAAAAQFSYGNCEEKDTKEKGLCIHIRDCPFLDEILNITKPTAAQRQLLGDSQCGLDNTRHSGLVQRILVCCPDSKRGTASAGAGSGTSGDSLSGDEPEPGNVLPSIGKCGILFANRILGGTKAKLYEFPWMALLKYKTKQKDEYTFNCGGALINSRYVLTAGHCLASNKLDQYGLELHSVRLGEWDTSTAPDCETELNKKKTCAPLHIDVLIEKKILHDLYIPDAIDQMHDIALLRLKDLVRFTDYVKPICLPVGDDIRNNNFVDYAMDVAGWGATEDDKPSNIKLKITVDVWNLKPCQDKYRTYQMHINGSQLCAGGKNNVDTCRGDSGGPLMVLTNVAAEEVFFVAGITSYGPIPCGLPGWPGVYTRVGHYVDWVIHNLEA
ncbi:spaetzle-processing enzyme-like [Drosophila sulfurigaster albostrigata]|uniref:spaetzle-processing enzyme-like n=1 Tax=Drosophila sulfurigaster albostrigata TaxID=89887 RepID=UPI002D219A8E|nr:spaetzle-processing enzyme-like [Drosophila sulfurigaster albostrigata]